MNEATQLEMQHRSWKVLKLAGVYSVFNEHEMVEASDIIEAITIAEQNSDDLNKFIELSKREHYEQLIDLLKIEGSITVHNLKKKELITGRANPQTQVENMIRLGNSALGSEGMLKFSEDVVSLELFAEVSHGASYKMVTGTKEERAFKVADGFTYKKSGFDNLAKLLCNDTSYTAFEFRDGKRSNDSIMSGATFAVLDIDDSDISWTEAHDMLQDFNHHVAKTSSNDNPYKFRVMIELDIEVNIDSRLWKAFMGKLGNYIGLKLDLLPQSQQFYGYEDRDVLSTLDGDALPASEFVKNLDVDIKPVKRLSPQKVLGVIEDSFDVFSYAYEYSGEWGGTTMFRAFKHLQSLGGSEEQVVTLLQDICDYRSVDFDAAMKRTSLLSQIQRAYLV